MNARTSNDDASDLFAWRVIHRAMRGETESIVRMLRELAPDDAPRARRLRSWFAFVERTLHHHHVMEDRWFFPLLERRDPSFAGAREALDAEHARIEPALRRTMDRLRRLPEAPPSERATLHAEARHEAESFLDALTQHLNREEAEVGPRARAHLRDVDYDAFHRRVARSLPIQDTRTLLPWLLEYCTPEEGARLLQGLPAYVRWMHRILWAPRQRRMRAALR